MACRLKAKTLPYLHCQNRLGIFVQPENSHPLLTRLVSFSIIPFFYFFGMILKRNSCIEIKHSMVCISAVLNYSTSPQVNYSYILYTSHSLVWSGIDIKMIRDRNGTCLKFRYTPLNKVKRNRVKHELENRENWIVFDSMKFTFCLRLICQKQVIYCRR